MRKWSAIRACSTSKPRTAQASGSITAAAVVALAAVQRRVDGDPVADGHLRDGVAEGDDLAGKLVSRYDRQGGRELAVEDVQVGPADPAAGDGHDDVSPAGGRVRHRRDLDVARSGDDGCLHVTAPMLRSRPTPRRLAT